MCSNLWGLPFYASLPMISARERASFTYFTCQCAVTGYGRFITGENQLVGRLALDKGTSGLQSFIISTLPLSYSMNLSSFATDSLTAKDSWTV